jgi:topoisomerase-4 subunit A
MAQKEAAPPGGGGDDKSVTAVELRDALEERYLRYALSTITGRALPDARDGLKPVHRRILYGMHILRLDPGAPFKKCAKIVGDVMGSFHPHGDQAIYDALVRLAQDFSSRYPLVDGQGNFGNIDGDSAAAYRYTEARMTALARLLLEGIDEDAIDFKPNYSGEEQEPIVLPSALPNLLANGSQGIAVGMATSVPPHNAAELLDAALYLIAHRGATAEQLMTFVQGPDFPTGGVVVDKREDIAETYRTGRGSFRMRARWQKEELARGGWVAVVTEIPYGVQKSRLIERLAELVNEKKLPLVAEVRDESAEDIRIVFEPRARTVEPALMMETLFKLSELEQRFPVNMNVLVDGVTPRVVSLDEALRQWLDHRRDVLQRRSRHRLAAIVRRLEQLDGMIVVFLNLDEVIRIIREEDDAKAALKAAFELTDLQTDYILDTRLRALRKLEEMELRKEHVKLTEERAEVESLLGDEHKQWRAITAQIRELKKTLGAHTVLGKRRTTFEDAPAAADIDLTEAMIEKEPITIVVSQKGWIRSLKGHVADVSTLAYKGDDALDTACFAQTTSKLLVFASNGKVFTIDAAKLPGGRGHGEPIRLFADIEEDAGVVKTVLHMPGAARLLIGDDGRGFVAAEDDLLANTRKGRNVLTLDGAAKLKIVAEAQGDHIAIIGENRKLLVFPLEEAPRMARGKGVRMQRYRDGGVCDAKVFALGDGLTWTDSSGRVFTVAKAELAEWIGHRSEAGRLPPRGFPKNNRFG